MNQGDILALEVTAMRHLSEIRGLLATRNEDAQREAARLLLSSRGEPQWSDLLRYAQGCDEDALSPDRLVQWSEVTDAYRSTTRYEGVLTVCGVELAVPDMDAITHGWATRPGWCVLDLWESYEWARSEDGASYRSAPRWCLETVDAYHRDAATLEQVIEARDAAAASAAAASAASTSAAYAHAAYAAYAASAASTSAYATAAYAAYATADYAAYATADADADAAAERERSREDWRWHLIHYTLKGITKEEE